MLIENYRHKITLSPRFADVDMLGHVNNAKYITYIEEARIIYADEVFRGERDAEDVFMILAKTVIDYLLPIHHSQIVEVYTRCARLGRKSFDLEYLMVRAVDHEIISTAVTTMVAYDYAAQKSILIPDEWKHRIREYEKLPPES